MKFSIVTPSFNQGNFIEETIESVLSQAGPFQIEYFVMDGGSTDNTVAVLQRYADLISQGQYPIACEGVTFHWHSGRDGGQSDAINKGLQQSTGDICSYINSDDLFFAGAFSAIARGFEANPGADFVYGDGDVIDEAGNLQWQWLARPYDHRVMTGYHFLWNEFTNYIMQQATFWRRTVTERIGYFDESMHYAMDAEYWVRAGAAGMELVHIPEKIGKFRMIVGTKSLSSPTVFWSDQLEIFLRYRPLTEFGRFFSFFVFNLARHHDWNYARAASEALDSCSRWKSLPQEQSAEFDRQVRRGLADARLRIGRQLFRSGQREEAISLLRRAIAQSPTALPSSSAAAFVSNLIVGNTLYSAFENLQRSLIAQYRRMRFDYRYAHKS